MALYRPDLDRLRRTDPSFTAVVEDRRSVRVFDQDTPLVAAQVGELLYRAARRSGYPIGRGGEPQERRPYPSGGGLHDLVLYPVVQEVTGLPPGMYRELTAPQLLVT